ncbi:hypothetical protein A4A49_55312 [Nicotiana attenuata]|uniref:RNase H type-1 domain-containing protein n=1 Tax=Nicotiana attenuata TaxID=49451 RepID=A0A1J6IUX0_NICAT|nr:hypothetical protein A4A49_55312 [Nicotiana attenuata]
MVSFNGYDRVILEFDSKLVVDKLNIIYAPPWNIKDIIREAHQCIHEHNIIIKHCFREENNVAYVLAKWSHDIQEALIFNQMNLTKQAIGHYRLDKMQVPNQGSCPQ